MNGPLTIALLAGFALVLAGKVTRATGRLTVDQVRQLADQVVARSFSQVDPLMLRAMVEIESGRDPNAFRYEAHINDASVGLMQTLLGTARWLATDMGHNRYGVPTLADLSRPEVSMYFGAAYVNWLRRYGGSGHSEEWIVRAYNGGPGGASSPATKTHWNRYQAAKQRLTEG